MKTLPQRKSVRLKNFDYSSSGWYFITICTQNRKCLFGNIVNGEMVLNDVGKMVKNIWESLLNHHSVQLDTFQLMPSHVHFVIQIVGATRGSPALLNKKHPLPSEAGASRRAPTGLGTIVGLFKSECTKQIRRTLKKSNMVIWQRNYHEHVIRNEKSLNRIQEYIINNPKTWDGDKNNPKNLLKSNTIS